ncbi:probable serine/threonine-protein kinase clkA [Teleopsis dalmanni]|uniref:probable serine/threonine-protein kinase clkA n=1 Tax=Teleopsis dalmanni TaxID=139649 RepID=UPI0018CD6008|nr:probable serine/threonine-protein kinase clkA [Teleopsis dalmanni]XP_037928215.1 probable serine/threonine-protein kinase clkA [Teleopsis dalmanni]XP_037928216.1 probable serine/threonine-protein kinase clkA [Teleopsis dalmanni]XP_037928217.1 probable serine/threonine-protein kinase clkA [Teleopsis dalmanni]XP_037928218.1 probable serine/threonine-protein kinase clkA [Teleopsis dalmanni]
MAKRIKDNSYNWNEGLDNFNDSSVLNQSFSMKWNNCANNNNGESLLNKSVSMTWNDDTDNIPSTSKNKPNEVNETNHKSILAKYFYNDSNDGADGISTSNLNMRFGSKSNFSEKELNMMMEAEKSVDEDLKMLEQKLSNMTTQENEESEARGEETSNIFNNQGLSTGSVMNVKYLNNLAKGHKRYDIFESFDDIVPNEEYKGRTSKTFYSKTKKRMPGFSFNKNN